MTFTIPQPIIKPYCNSGALVEPPMAVSTTVANQETGWPSLQATPLSSGGLPVQIEEFNGVINFYSQQVLAWCMGYQQTFNSNVSDQNSGYPEGIVLYCSSNNSYQRSLIDNNTANFNSTPTYIDDGVHWSSSQYINTLSCTTFRFYSADDNTRYTEFVSPSTTSTYFWPDGTPISAQGYFLNSDAAGHLYWQYVNSQYVLGNTSGSAPSAGFVGEQLLQTGLSPSPAVPDLWGAVVTLPLEEGVYLLYGNMNITFSGVLVVNVQYHIGKTTSSTETPPSDLVLPYNSGYLELENPHTIDTINQNLSGVQITIPSGGGNAYLNFMTSYNNARCLGTLIAVRQ